MYNYDKDLGRLRLTTTKKLKIYCILRTLRWLQWLFGHVVGTRIAVRVLFGINYHDTEKKNEVT
jgi:hypothetical protein